MTETNTLKDGTIITGFKNDLITNGLRTTKNYYESAMLEFIKNNIAKGVMVDVGANIGNHTIYLAKYCATKVIAYEPFPATYELLKSNIFQNNIDNVKLRNYGLSDESKEVFMSSVEGNAGMNKIDDNGSIQVKVVPFDSDAPNEPITLIKLDCEGYEYKALLGMMDTLKEHLPALFIECQTLAELNNIRQLLRPLGYDDRHKFNHTPTYHFSL